MLDDLDVVHDVSGRRRRRTKRYSSDKPDPAELPPAFLLTTDEASDLAKGLDASDILECYWLTRRVYLQGIANQTLSISKTALGLRYRPDSDTQKREIVLEYGPDRAGTKNEYDMVPVVLDGTYVSWQNEGRVYYSKEIHALQYQSATFVASVTGAVVSVVLQEAARYASLRGSKRYQPWQVMDVKEGGIDGTTAVVKLRSSSDVDFVTYLMERLASLGVDLRPVLRPTVYSLELTTSSVVRDTLTPSMKLDMATFYQRLHVCLEQLASGQPAKATPVATIAPSVAPLPTAAPSIDNATTSVPTYPLYFDVPVPTAQPTLGDRRLAANETEAAPSPSWSPSTAVPTSLPTSQPTIILPPSPADPPPSSTVADAQKAAEAANAAAQNATDIESATQAAQQAVDAAQQAVDVTVTQEALLRQEALLSGNGQSMALTASLCFSDPIYGIRERNESVAYLYWDASYYFSLKLVHPYIRVVPETWIPPQPPSLSVSPFARGGGAVDWSLAILILTATLVGIFLLIQRLNPSSSWRSQWFYKYQRWFFDPMHHNYDEEADDEEIKRVLGSGAVRQHRIPFAMGARPTSAYLHAGIRRRGNSKELFVGRHLDDDSVGGSGGDVELVVASNNESDDDRGAFSDQEEDFMDEAMSGSTHSHRLFRDPKLVELPDLTGSSKVAVPVSVDDFSSA